MYLTGLKLSGSPGEPVQGHWPGWIAGLARAVRRIAVEFTSELGSLGRGKTDFFDEHRRVQDTSLSGAEEKEISHMITLVIESGATLRKKQAIAFTRVRYEHRAVVWFGAKRELHREIRHYGKVHV